jgi:hypothetical protein
MEKKRVKQARSSRLDGGSLKPLQEPALAAVRGESRVRIPIGFTDTGDPIYGDDDGG